MIFFMVDGEKINRLTPEEQEAVQAAAFMKPISEEEQEFKKARAKVGFLQRIRRARKFEKIRQKKIAEQRKIIKLAEREKIKERIARKIGRAIVSPKRVLSAGARASAALGRRAVKAGRAAGKSKTLKGIARFGETAPDFDELAGFKRRRTRAKPKKKKQKPRRTKHKMTKKRAMRKPSMKSRRSTRRRRAKSSMVVFDDPFKSLL